MRGKYSNQTGNIPVFIIVGVLLTALLTGGIYLVRHNLTTAGSNPTVSQNSNPDQPAEDKKDSAEQKAADEKAQMEAEQKRAEEQRAAEQAKNDQQKQAADKQAAEKKAAEEKAASNQVASNQNIPHTGASTPAQQLPQTGPAEDAFMAFVGLAALFGVSIAYLKSHFSLYGRL